MESRTYIKLARKLVICEERTKLLRMMIQEGVGFREEEQFVLHEAEKLKGNNDHFKKERREILAPIMKRKLKDNIIYEKNLRTRRDQARREMESTMGPNSTACRKVVKKSKEEGTRLRLNCKKKNTSKLRFLINKYGMRDTGTSMLCEEDWQTYRGARVFKDEDIKPEKMRDPVIVCREGENIVLSDEEMSILRLGPKFCEYVQLDDEEFEGEVEQAILKYKWETMEKGNNEKSEVGGKFVDTSSLAREILDREIFTKEELEEIDEEIEEENQMREAQCRNVFDLNTGTVDMRKRRTTDVKGNSRVVLPRKMREFEVEAKLEMFRQETRGTMTMYMREACGPRGLQKSNLTRGEIKGLRSLRKRIKEGELVVMPTDKTGLFAIMTRETYTECGMKHTRGDTEVDWGDIKTSQNEINGHTSMLIKIFSIGEDWKHTSRIRESMLGESMATCPLTLLYKDHKGWTSEMRTCPPTRPVAGGHLGMNLHLSEVVSDLVEPLVDKYEGGRENISTEDLIARVVGLNDSNQDWHKWSWWKGQTWGAYEACDNKCAGDWGDIQLNEDPELCKCVSDQLVCNNGRTRVTARWLKAKRRTEWEKDVGFDPLDTERTWSSEQVLPEDLQNYQVPMVILGSDVVSLYPNLDINKVGDRVKEAVLSSNIKWEGVNYLEAVRYIALNWTEDKCRGSKLRRVLPWRRKRTGTRPGIRGAGPRGPEIGDQDQWVFPRVVLTPEDKKEILGTVLSIATTALFKNHFYSFGGKMFKQEGGGPIGLRGTCALARLMMQIFDVKWEDRLTRLRVVTWLISRYMDDGRTCLPPLKPGWRWDGDSLKFKIQWEREDQELSDTEITRRGLVGTLQGVEDYLEFTVETCEDFGDGWLPTMDTSLRVDRKNQVQFKFYEKPTSSNTTVQRRTAMGEDTKIQIVSNDLVRRLKNNSEDLGQGAKVEIVDNYTQKLRNSGYTREQLKKIISNGITGYEGRRRRCLKEGRFMHRTSVNSQGARIRKKLLAKSNWFKKKKKVDQSYQPSKGSPGGPGSWKPGPWEQLKYDREPKLETKTILFVAQTPRGELARRMRETIRNMEPTLGFKVKVVERAGQTLGSKFPLSTLWEGAKCGRTDCTTCEQMVEDRPKCTSKSLVYENICIKCNPGATNKGELEQVKSDIPTIYVGETSRSIFERSKEHWEGAKGGATNNHMLKHQSLEHGGEQPEFAMKVVRNFRTALARQVAEAVRIRRRGGEGAILNSRGEFNRSHIPRLRIEEEEPAGAREARMKEREHIRKNLKEQDKAWEQRRAEALGAEAICGPRSSPIKRSNEEYREYQSGGAPKAKRRKKKRKHELLGKDWGEQDARGTEMEVEPITTIQGSCARIPREQDLTQPTMVGFLVPEVGGEQPAQDSIQRGADDTTTNPELHATPGRKLNQPKILKFLEPVSAATADREGDVGEQDALFEVDTVGGEGEELKDDNKEGDVAPAEHTDDQGAEVGLGIADVGLNNCQVTPSTNKEGELTPKKKATRSSMDEEVCSFKRGGMCVVHKKYGKKNTSTQKVWDKNKSGIFSWKYKKKTYYTCEDGTVVKNDSSAMISNGTEGQTDRALGLDNIEILDNTTVQMFSGDNFGISGEVVVGQAPNQRK